MALLKYNYQSDFGIIIPESYVRVTTVHIDRNEAPLANKKYIISAQVVHFATALPSARPIHYNSYLFYYDTMDTDAIAWVYAQLKLLPEFSGAGDI